MKVKIYWAMKRWRLGAINAGITAFMPIRGHLHRDYGVYSGQETAREVVFIVHGVPMKDRDGDGSVFLMWTVRLYV